MKIQVELRFPLYTLPPLLPPFLFSCPAGPSRSFLPSLHIWSSSARRSLGDMNKTFISSLFPRAFPSSTRGAHVAVGSSGF